MYTYSTYLLWGGPVRCHGRTGLPAQRYHRRRVRQLHGDHVRTHHLVSVAGADGDQVRDRAEGLQHLHGLMGWSILTWQTHNTLTNWYIHTHAYIYIYIHTNITYNTYIHTYTEKSS